MIDHDNLPDLVNALRQTGRHASPNVFRSQEGLLISKAPDPASEGGDFFPIWELNQHLDLVAARNFDEIKRRRPRDWSPVQR